MDKRAHYVKSIEINALWRGGRRVVWNLQPDVNILSGINGVGKSTILKQSARALSLIESGELRAGDVCEGVLVKFYPEDATVVRYDVISSFDRPLLHGDLLEKLADARVHTEMDWQIYRLQKRYLDYQVNLGNKIIEALSEGGDDSAQKAALYGAPRREFQDLLDSLFRDTGKRLDRKSNEIRFIADTYGVDGGKAVEYLTPYQLSAGEKQMLVILLTVLVEDGEPYVLLMDEPEISLHIEWQQRLIALIRRLNPNVQIILSTHSPALIMDGWMTCVTEMDEIAQ